MRIIPVIDLMGGVVVRAVAGRRHEYRPIRSQLVDSPDPPHVARRLLEASGATEFYVADLDAIVTGQPVEKGVRDFLLALSKSVWVAWFDGGFRTEQVVRKFEAAVAEEVGEFASAVSAVVASETFGPPPRRGGDWAYSIDLRDGRSLCDSGSPMGLAELAVAAGFRTLIVLDVARVGTSDGPGTTAFLGDIRARFPEVELIAGGGIRGANDLARLTDLGIDAVLVASALHDGRLRG